MEISKNKITYFLLLLFFAINISSSQSSNIRIEAKSSLGNLLPGNHYTLFFEITNQNSTASNLNIEYTLPSEFNLLLSKKTKEISANGKSNILVTFSVSKNCKAGLFNVEIKLKEKNNTVALYSSKVEVSKFYNLSIEPIEQPNYLRFQKEFTCKYLVTNNGNSEEKIKFHSERSLKVFPLLSILKPDSAVVVEVTQKVPFSPFNKTTALNLLKAEISSNGKIFSNRIPILVYPNSTKKPDLYNRFPVSFSTIYNSVKGLDTVSAVKFRIEGSGYLDRKKDHFLNFLLSGPNQIEMTRFGEYDQYYLHYKNKKMELFAGDITYTLSKLTEASRSGFGSILNYKLKNSEATIFYLNPRFTDKISGAFGGDFNWFISQKTNIKLGIISRTLIENKNRIKSQLYSLTSNYSSKYFKLSGEIAYENNRFSDGYGFSIESNLNTNKIYWGNSVQYSDKDFKGYLRNSQQYLSYFNYKVSKKLSSQLNANYRSINPVKDDINYSSSPIISYYQAFLNYRINRSNRLKLGGSLRKKEDRFNPKKFHFEEKLLSLNYTLQKANKYSFGLINSYGKTKNFLTSNATPQQVFFSSIEMSTNLLENLSFGLSANFERTNKNSLSNELINSFYYGGNLQYQIRNSLNLNLFYRSDYAEDEIEADVQSYIEAQLEYNISKNHQLSFSASQSSIPSPNSVLDKELFLNASYRFIVNTPLSKDKTRGVLKGEISSNNQENLEGILISFGNNATVTNKKGEFIIYNITPNEYLLNIAQSSLPKNKIIIESLPQKIDILPNKETYFQLNLGNAGNLIGEVKLKEIEFTQSSKFIKKLPKIVVKIYNENQKFLTQTNNEGVFKFAKLTPGEWTIEILVKNLTNDFVFIKTMKTINIIPNEETSIFFEVENKNRKVKRSKKTFKL